MAAPIATPPGTPEGIKLKDGFPTTIGFAAAPTVSLWEKQVKPPGLDGGEKIEQSTMRNVTYRTYAPRSLKTLTDMTSKCAYDPNVYGDLNSIINVETTVTVRFADGSTLAFYGFLGKFEPDELTEGGQPTASVTICPTNFDPVNKVEAAPVLTEAAGT